MLANALVANTQIIDSKVGNGSARPCDRTSARHQELPAFKIWAESGIARPTLINLERESQANQSSMPIQHISHARRAVHHHIPSPGTKATMCIHGFHPKIESRPLRLVLRRVLSLDLQH